MLAERHIPQDILKPFVKTFTIVESESGMENLILPDTSLVLAFRYKGTLTSTVTSHKKEILATSVISGLRKSALKVKYSGHTGNILIAFTVCGAAAFFTEPLHEFFDRQLSLDHIIPATLVCEIEERLSEAKTHRRRVDILEQFLLSRLRKSIKTDPLVASAIEKVMACKGNLRISDLISELPISRDPFEKRFRRMTGASPKQFSTIIRLKHAIANHSAVSNLTELAHMSGYYDQAHFIKDFKIFTGQTPQEFFKTARYW